MSNEGPWEGPWELVLVEPYDLELQDTQGHCIARVILDDAPVEDYNRRQYASGRLMAAAPELLALVLDLLKRVGTKKDCCGQCNAQLAVLEKVGVEYEPS